MRPLVVGILNCTPDSFYDGGRQLGLEAALAQAERLIAEGADWIDVGGESTRPGAAAVPPEEEARRVLPVLAALAGRTTLSIDTRRPCVARRAREAGAVVLNDVTGLQDPEMAAISGEFEAVVVMHSRGDPSTMSRLTDYGDVRAEVGDWLEQAAGRSRCPRVWLDPGIGFAKTAAQSLSLMKGLPELVARGWPVLVGASRKSFIGAALGLGSPEERLHGSLGAAAWAARAGVGALRVHDVRATRELLDMMAAIQGAA